MSIYKKIVICIGILFINQVKVVESLNDVCLSNAKFDCSHNCTGGASYACKDSCIRDYVSGCVSPKLRIQRDEKIISLVIDGKSATSDILTQLNRFQQVSLSNKTQTISWTGSKGSKGSWTNQNLPIPTDAISYSIILRI